MTLVAAPRNRGRARRRIAPEVVQTSPMDCGPAALKCLLEGHGIPASYGRLREVCQTDVDGTSIDTIEDVACELGLDAEQITIPRDHLALAHADVLPAVVVTRLPDGATHFVVVWSRIGGRFQVMDPGTGRRWPKVDDFIDLEVYEHSTEVPAADWREWAGSEAFVGPLTLMLTGIVGSKRNAAELIESALADPAWHSIAALDAAARMTRAVVSGGGLRRGRLAGRVLASFFERARGAAASEEPAVPSAFWQVRPSSDDECGEPRLVVRGAVLVRVLGQAAGPAGDEEDHPAQLAAVTAEATLTPEPRPGRELLRLLAADGALAPALVAGACGIAAFTVLIQAVLFRGLIDLGARMGSPGQRAGAVAALGFFLLAALLLELPIATSALRFGRRLEGRLRVAFQEKIPRLGERFFHSRPSSDMAERGHSLVLVRDFPSSGLHILRTSVQLALTAAGIVWIDPSLALLAVSTVTITVLLPLFACEAVLVERELRVRAHQGALGRFHLDALLGLVPARTHGAERALRREHGALLAEWLAAGLRLVRSAVATEGVVTLVASALAATIVLVHLPHADEVGGTLLLVFWALCLPALGGDLALTVREYPAQRNSAKRVLEPLGAPEDDCAPDPEACPASQADADNHTAAASARTARGVSIELRGVDVLASGHPILTDVELSIEPGSHVAIVGPSGAGKSSLVGLLLGWHVAAAGRVLVDGAPLDARRLAALRRETAWVDPSVQLWNRSLLENLLYGSVEEAWPPVGWALEYSDLLSLLEKLPGGLGTSLGEGGGLLSGGEGQRVRFARSIIRKRVRLVILDEPFRGLEAARRRALTERARAHWRTATLLCVTHDIAATRSFDQVIVVEGGRVVESGSPAELEREDSRFRALAIAEREARETLWGSDIWRRVELAGGRLVESRPQGAQA